MELTTRLLQFEWIGGAKLPSTVAYFAGELRNEPVDWSVGPKTLVVVLEMASANPGTPTQISGGLWATADGLELRDGSGNVAEYACTWNIGDALIVALTITAEGKMKLGLLIEQVINLLSARYLHTENYINLENYA